MIISKVKDGQAEFTVGKTNGFSLGKVAPALDAWSIVR
jgi:hypothetical protein